MTSAVQIDTHLLERAKELSGTQSDQEVLETALTEYVSRREQLRVLELFGTVEDDPTFDYKAQRRVS